MQLLTTGLYHPFHFMSLARGGAGHAPCTETYPVWDLSLQELMVGKFSEFFTAKS